MDWVEQGVTLSLAPYGLLLAIGFCIFIVGVFLLARRRRRPAEPEMAPTTLIGQTDTTRQPVEPKRDGEAEQKAAARDTSMIQKDIEDAEAAGNDQALAALHLEQARSQLSRSEVQAAADQLRLSVMLATTHDLKKIHAAARLELAGLSEADGDLTTACEHWQIARNLFHALERTEDVQKTDERMLSNGCPTDWVLTDF